MALKRLIHPEFSRERGKGEIFPVNRGIIFPGKGGTAVHSKRKIGCSNLLFRIRYEFSPLEKRKKERKEGRKEGKHAIFIKRSAESER